MNFTFLGSKIDRERNCTHELKICIFSGKKIIADIDKILMSRDII